MSSDASLSIALGGASGDEVPVLVSVLPREGTARTPVDIICVIDTSWSMSMEVKVQSASGTSESNGLSMLDLAKHAVRTVMKSADPNDRIGIVEFCRESKVVYPLSEMNEVNRHGAERALNSIGFGSGTNLWGGMEAALKCMRTTGTAARMGHILVLTDGETEEKESVVPNMVDFKQTHEGFPGTLSFFGFGYEIDSPLLVKLANLCDGTYAFIPDGGFVGTCFVNSVSNLQATLSRDAILRLEPQDGSTIAGVLGGWQMQGDASGMVTIGLGTLQYGQSKDIVVRMKAPHGRTASLHAGLDFSTLAGKAHVEIGTEDGSAKGPEVCEPARCRSLAVDTLNRAVQVATTALGSDEALKEARDMLTSTVNEIKRSSAAEMEQVKALLEDLQGQSMEALAKQEWWQKWGRHYIPSVACAHRLQQCNNFKDPGVQHYGSELFTRLRDAADDAFNTLPAPDITPAEYRYLGNGKLVYNSIRAFTPAAQSGASAAPVTVDMSAYNDRHGVCIDGDCLARLASCETRRVSDLAKGDVVLALGREGEEVAAKVECAIRSRCLERRAVLAELSTASGRALRLTPYHPVLAEGGEWRFPAELGVVADRECDAVYSFVLSDDAVAVLVEGVACATWGHGLGDGAAAHPYFGSRLAVEDLRGLPGYGAGLVDLSLAQIIRDPITGLVSGLRFPAQA